jgi:hypothetical protein
VFTTWITRAFHWSLSWARSIQSIPPHPISVRFTLHVPNLMSLFFSLSRLFREPVHVRDPLWHSVTSLFSYGEELAPRPTPKLKDHPLSAVRGCLFNIFATVFSIRNLGTHHAVVTRDPHNMDQFYIFKKKRGIWKHQLKYYIHLWVNFSIQIDFASLSYTNFQNNAM